MKILVTGGLGFLGSFLGQKLQKADIKFVNFEGDLLNSADRAKYFYKGCDWTSVVHLAGIGSVPGCDADHSFAFQNNATATFLVVEEIKRFCPAAQLVFSSTGQVYDLEHGLESPVDESHDVRPSNIYAKTKRAAELYIEDSYRKGNGSYVILRIFNHSHKSQRPEFFMPSIYQQILAKKNQENPVVLEVGNMNLERDIGAIQDIIEAFYKIIVQRRDGKEIYNLCSGTGKTLTKVVRTMAEELKIQVELKTIAERVRLSDPPRMVASCEKLCQHYNWKPQFARDEYSLVQSFLANL